MGGVADAVGGLAGGVVGGLAGGLFGAEGAQDANRSATNAQLQGIRESNALQRDLFNASADMGSYGRGIGNQALGLMASLYGFQPGTDPASSVRFGEDGELVTTPGASGSGAAPPGAAVPNFNALFQTPDYVWALQQGQQGLDRAAAAGGGLFSGNRLKEAVQYNQGMATQQFGNTWNRLASLAGIGQSGTNQLDQSLQNAGNNISQGLMGMGNARASGYQNHAAIDQNARLNMFSTLIGGGNMLAKAGMFSDRRLKSKIERIGTHPSGLPWYSYEIFGQPSEGVMADEVLQVNPDAVSVHESGFLMVDYSALGGV